MLITYLQRHRELDTLALQQSRSDEHAGVGGKHVADYLRHRHAGALPEHTSARTRHERHFDNSALSAWHQQRGERLLVNTQWWRH